MLKQSLIFSLVLLAADAVAQRNVDVLHYKYGIELNDNNDTIYGNAEIKLRFLSGSSSVEFDLAGVAKNKGMIVTEANFNRTGDAGVSFQHNNPKLTITSGAGFKQGDTATVFVRYKGIPSDGLIISRNKYGHRTFFADNWPNRGHNWLPCVDEPGDKASVEFIVTAPLHYQVVSNGILVEETNLDGNRKLSHWREDVPLSTKVMVIGVADFAVNLAGVINEKIPVYSWVYPEDRNKGFYDYAQATEIIPFFISKVGPYGYKKLANVQSKTTFGGLENANTIFYHENSVDGTRKSESLLAHEIAHQWFGNMATEKSFAHLWLSEGFATYMTIMYMENKYGQDTARYMLAEDRQQVIAHAKKSRQPVVDETKNYMELLNANSYQKGGWILHMLRKRLGDSVFSKAVRSYYEMYAGGNADTRDLQKVFEKISRKDLSKFFDQWLYSPGIPRLEASWSYNPAKKQVEVSLKQSQDNMFTFPLELQIRTATGSKMKTLNVTMKEQTFTLPAPEKVSEILLDPDLELLFEGSIRAN